MLQQVLLFLFPVPDLCEPADVAVVSLIITTGPAVAILLRIPTWLTISSNLLIHLIQKSLRQEPDSANVLGMDELGHLPHTLARIAERPNILHWHSEQISSDSRYCVQLARPLFDAGLGIAAITQRSSYDSGPHTSHCYRFTLLLRGSMMMRFEDEEHQVSPGQIACCPPNTLFRRWSDSATWWVYFDFNEHKTWKPLKKHGPYVRDHPSPDLIYILLQQLTDLHRGLFFDKCGEEEREERLDQSTPQAVEYADLLLNILRQECAALRKPAGTQIDRLHALVQEIRLAPQNDWNVETMSQHIHVSRSTLRRLTMSEYNLAPMQLVIQARMEEAVRWLRRPENSVMAIAQHVGYQSVYSFTRLFTKHMGMPPGKYRDTVLHKKGR